MLPLGLFRSREFSGAVVIGAAINTGFYGELFLLSLYLHDVRHFSPVLAGLALLPQPGIASLASAISGRHTARFGARPVMLVGLSVGALGLFSMMFAGTATPYWVLVVPLLAIGFGTAYTMPAATAAAIEAAPDGHAGIASGTLNASRQLGSTLGVVVFGTLVAATGTFMAGYRLSVFVGGLVFAAGAVIAWRARFVCDRRKSRLPSRYGGVREISRPHFAAPAELIGHPARAAILLALLDGRALPMSMLADEAGVAASTASAHLSRLVEGGLLRVRQEGRRRYYALASPKVAAALEALAQLAPVRPVRSLRAGTRAQALRVARTCYDHVAGHLGGGSPSCGHCSNKGHCPVGTVCTIRRAPTTWPRPAGTSATTSRTPVSGCSPNLARRSRKGAAGP
jgi:DNA-binding transcriptional ArsR family regulator